MLKQLNKCLVERALESEMNNHLGYDKYTRSDIENTRNGTSKKSLITESGTTQIEAPGDRNSSFASFPTDKLE